ncbi:protein translocase subunit SecD [Flaviflagellibacter deserti]|jgi:protein-export membrane protein SecD|uniref:Protein translocase subunit SecD n=1 Tax=Flaviflagellibacter deserti TaxID=2267266 RepID=A0ABV9Z4C4_9HYPH
MLHYSRTKTILTLLVVALGLLFVVPNLLSPQARARLPSFLQNTIVLGLDLQGGSHILLEVDAQALRNEKLEALRDQVRTALRDARIGYTGLGNAGQGVQVRLRDVADLQAATTKLRELRNPISSSLLGNTGQFDLDVTNTPDGLVTLTPTEAGVDARIRSAVDQSIEIVRRRVDELGTTEPSIQRQGADRILVQVPGLQDPQRLKELIGTTAKLTFRMVDVTMPVQQAEATRPPPESEILVGAENPNEKYLVEKRILVAGEDLVDAQPGFSQQTNEPIVSFRFNSNGARRFATATQQNVGKPFAIVLDNKVISAPRINEPITGGSGQISGSFTVESANNLAILLRAGALPAPLTVVEERTVGPGLGQDSIDAGTKATIYAAIFVVIFMFATYGTFGLIANIALIIHVGLIFGLMSLIGATLTLPGIAGIVLTIGTAVDSNVLIYERIREEFHSGRSMVSAIQAGFERAFATIVDSNSTMAIAAVILFLLGSGPVKGFAVVFVLGILTTVITAVTMTRMMIALWYRWTRAKALPF